MHSLVLSVLIFLEKLYLARHRERELIFLAHGLLRGSYWGFTWDLTRSQTASVGTPSPFDQNPYNKHCYSRRQNPTASAVPIFRSSDCTFLSAYLLGQIIVFSMVKYETISLTGCWLRLALPRCYLWNVYTSVLHICACRWMLVPQYWDC